MEKLTMRVWHVYHDVPTPDGPIRCVSLKEAEAECAADRADMRVLRSELHTAREELRTLREDRAAFVERVIDRAYSELHKRGEPIGIRDLKRAAITASKEKNADAG